MGTGKSKGAGKEIATLRKFMHKNQDQRFTDKAISRMFDTIQLYVNNSTIDSELKEGLLEDALKMPFSVFGTKQKKTMIKWLEDIRGGPGMASTKTMLTQILSVIDVQGEKISLINDNSGDIFEEVPLPEGDLGAQLRSTFDSTESVVSVEVQIQGETIVHILRIVLE